MNTSIIINIISRLSVVEYTHNYINGFVFNGLVYYYETIGMNTEYLKLEKLPNGYHTVKYRPNNTNKKDLINSGICKVLCTESLFNEMVKNSKYNKGEIFEKLLTEKFGLEWKKDNIRVDKGADIETEEKSYSVKFEKARVIDENVLINIECGK